jgi:hypothetical protein
MSQVTSSASLPKRSNIMGQTGFGLRCLCVIGLSSLDLTSLSQPARAATIYTYDVYLNSFMQNSNPGLFGTAEHTTIAFNNGNATNQNQTYRYADIVGATVSSIGGTFSMTGSQSETLTFTGNTSDLFATTNAQGVLSLLAPFSPNIVTTDSVKISVNNGDYITLAGWWFTGTWQSSGNSVGDRAFGGLSTATPEPSTWSMLLAGLAGLGLRCRRRRITAPCSSSAGTRRDSPAPKGSSPRRIRSRME